MQNFNRNTFLLEKLKALVRTERKITAEIIELIKEIDSKRIYLDYGHTSMFAFLTKDMGYTSAAAMRRIDTARLSKEIPEIQEDLKSGTINLSQVSMLAQAVRQKEKESGASKSNPEKITLNKKRALLEKIKSTDLVKTQKTLAKELDLKVQTYEKKVYQSDESIRLEITLTKEQLTELERVKELISHQNPNPKISDLIEFLVKNYLKQKDPFKRQITSVTEAVTQQKSKRYIHPKVKALIFQRDQCCQWKDPITKQKCNSKFQLQIDHKKSVWLGGENKQENLQLLCSIHNQLKYRQEIRPY